MKIFYFLEKLKLFYQLITHDKLNIFYVSPRDVFKARVDPIVIMKTCDKFAERNVDVELIVPNYFRKANLKRKDLNSAYKIGHNFSIVRLPSLLWDTAPVFWVRLNKIFFHSIYSLIVLFKILFSSKEIKKIIYSKCLISSLPYILLIGLFKKYLNISFVYELHTFENNVKHRLVLIKQDAIICISESLRDIMCKSIGFNREKTAIARHSVEPQDYDLKIDKTEIRKQLGFLDSDFIIVYTGKVYFGSKQIEYIIKAAKMLKQFKFVIVGGNHKHNRKIIEKFGTEATRNIIFTGFVSMDKVIRFQLASDILLMYYPGDWVIKDFLSPGKMMEYMACGRAIISVDFKVLKEVLKNDYNSKIIESDNPKLLAITIQRLFDNPEECDIISQNAKRDSYKYTWDSRADIILEKVKSL